MNLELTGKLITILPQETGQGAKGPWIKQSFIIETEDQYPKKICITAWNDNAKTIQAIKPFSTVKLTISLESREYNGRWYTDVRAWKTEVVAPGIADPVDSQSGSYAMNPLAETTADPLQNNIQAEDDLPF